MNKFLIIAIVLIGFTVPNAVLAQRNGEWYIDETNRTGILARVNGGVFSGREFWVVFEFDRRCEPIFSSIEMKGRAFGSFLRQEGFPPQKVFLSVNGERYTWHGVYAEYSGGTEIGLGLTQAAWSALLSNPRTISFTELGVTSREVVRVFLKQLWFQFVPVFHGLQGRSTMKN